MLSACSGAFDTHGPQSSIILDDFWLMLGISSAIFVAVMVLLAYALFRHNQEPTISTKREFTLIGIGGFVLPFIVLSLLVGVTVDSLHKLTGPAPADALQIQVTGVDWWWDVYYPQSGVRTANEIHIPAGETVSILGLGSDVIHSFWVPQLAGKVDLIPGKPNEFKIKADQPGTYRGQCAEYCGIGHAKMAFMVIAQPRSEFDAWLAAQQQPANVQALDARAAAGQKVFMSSSCSACHGIKGTPANGNVGPDLTHLASRNMFAGDSEPLNATNLAQWISSPSSVKEGVKMPASRFSDEDLSALVAFLLSLN
ncbi:MAG TPA: cytochrome c oxidase subunit II [Dehalococcoidia bacterium]|nr:cytochrome c oxidase subunit II [Dehalococcoidia bacterium]